MSKEQGITRLLEIMAALRAPETGCPWDIEQTFQSIAHYTIEEAYEVVDAIERNDLADLKDELGDLLLQVVFHSRMAEEAGHFSFGDVVEAISEKMLRRHPHVFGTDEERAIGAQSGMWDRIKREEKAARGQKLKSILDDVPVGMPAFIRSVKLQKKAAKTGFDWQEVSPIFDKVREELGELEDEIHKSDNQQRQEEEFGDLLFILANLGRRLKIDPEEALRKANTKFVRRFSRIEEMFAEEGRTMGVEELEVLDAYWERVKAEEKL